MGYSLANLSRAPSAPGQYEQKVPVISSTKTLLVVIAGDLVPWAIGISSEKHGLKKIIFTYYGSDEAPV